MKAKQTANKTSLGDALSEGRALFLIIAATVLVYANSLSGAFVFDDTKQIAGNPALRSWRNIARAFTSDVWSFQRGTLTKDIPPPYYRPLFTAYLTLNYQLFGLWEPGWHLMNLLVHCGATAATYFLIRRLSNDRLTATVAAVVFGLHPAHVESVSWISGIPDPLAALFYLPSLIWYIRYRTEGKNLWLFASLLAYGASALCKETPLALPLILIVWELSRVRSPTVRKGSNSFAARLRKLIPRMVPYAAVAGVYLALRFSVLGRLSWKHPFMSQVPDSAIWMTVPFVFVTYLQHLVAPFYLSLIYGTSFVASATDPRFLVPLGIILALGIIFWVYRKKLSGEVWIGLALIIAPLLPVLNLRVFHFEYVVQDRYLYLPSIGFCYLLALLMARLAQRRAQLAALLAGIVIVAFGGSAFAQNRVWHDAVALWQRAIAYSPESWSAHYNLGLAYLNQNNDEAARVQLLEAQRLNPREPMIANNLALAQARTGDKAAAIVSVKAAIAMDPTLLEARNNLGTFLFDQGSFSDAQKEFATVLARDPTSTSARFNLARTLAAMSDYAGAIREFQTLLAVDANDVAARYELAFALAGAGHKPEAETEFNRALQMDRDAKRVDEMRQKFTKITRP